MNIQKINLFNTQNYNLRNNNTGKRNDILKNNTNCTNPVSFGNNREIFRLPMDAVDKLFPIITDLSKTPIKVHAKVKFPSAEELLNSVSIHADPYKYYRFNPANQIHVPADPALGASTRYVTTRANGAISSIYDYIKDPKAIKEIFDDPWAKDIKILVRDAYFGTRAEVEGFVIDAADGCYRFDKDGNFYEFHEYRNPGFEGIAKACYKKTICVKPGTKNIEKIKHHAPDSCFSTNNVRVDYYENGKIYQSKYYDYPEDERYGVVRDYRYYY